MLLPSDRITPQDQAAWNNLTRYDNMLATALPPKITKATQIIHDFATTGDCYLSTSWGKDSTVLVSLAAEAHIDVPIVHLHIWGQEMPETHTVRNTMLHRYPHLNYHELTLPPNPNRWWSTHHDPTWTKHQSDYGWRTIEQKFGTRRITGIRAEESRIRTLVQHRFGDTTNNTARPIGTWTATDIFAYLHTLDLPIHPAYAMNIGGTHDRRWLRVHSLGGITGADRGRADWETHYYGDIVNQAQRDENIIHALPTNRHNAKPASTIAAETNYPLTDVADTLHRLHQQGWAIRGNHHGKERWHKHNPWPPKPQWNTPPLF